MARDFAKEIGNADARSSGFRAWMDARKQHINSQLTAGDILAKNGVTLRKSGNQQEQISCPFHGTDKKPSAKYYPEDGNSPSHVWCYVCRERWDVIGLWKKFTGTTKFSDILFQIERSFGLTPPEPSMIPDMEDPYDPLKDEVDSMLNLCESRLREYRDKFEMQAHLKFGAILDQTRYKLARGALPLPVAKERLTMVLGKMSEKISPDGLMRRARAKTTANP
jgi:hypothetical protein